MSEIKSVQEIEIETLKEEVATLKKQVQFLAEVIAMESIHMETVTDGDMSKLWDVARDIGL